MRRLLVTADLLVMAALVAGGHVQEHAGRVSLVSPSAVDSFMGVPSLVDLVLAASAYWMATAHPDAQARGLLRG